jgi:predicted  nucleic acid-binding Zn-ribbon protein
MPGESPSDEPKAPPSDEPKAPPSDEPKALPSDEPFKTPEDKLDEETKKLADITGIINIKNTEKSESEKRKAALEKDVKDVAKVVEAYKKGYENIQKVKPLLDKYYRDMFSIIENTVTGQGKKDVIDGKIKEYDEKTKTLRISIEKDGDLWTKYENAKKDLDDAQKACNDIQLEYEKWKKLQDEIEADIKDVQNLKSMIDNSDEVIDAGKRYFWISEIKTVLDALPAKIIIPEGDKLGLKYKLDETLNNLEEKNNIRDDKNKELISTKKSYEDAQKELELREKNRRNEILQIIKDLYQ